MAETTITGLPNATTPLDGTERVPMDQNGATVDGSTQAIANLALADTSAARTALGLATTDSPAFAGLTITGTAPVVIPHIHGGIAGNFYVHVRNASGGALAAGTAVYATGSVGDTDRIRVAACDPTDPLKMPAIGVLETTLANNGDGDAVILGELRPFNSNSYQLGDQLYVGAGGALVATIPASGEVQQVGSVVRVNVNTGTILVNTGAAMARVGFTGAYGDLSGRPTLGGAGVLTVNVPADYATIQGALNSINDKILQAGTTFRIKVADGTYTLASSIIGNHPQGDQIEIIGNETTPSNCVITVSGLPTFDALVVSNSHKLGRLNGFRFTLSSKPGLANNFTAILAESGSQIICGPDIETNNWYYGIAARNGSFISCDGASVNNAGDVGIWAFVGSTIYCRNATSNNVTDAANGWGFGFQAEYGSAMDCSGSSASGCRVGGIASLSGSTVRAYGCTASSNTGSGFFVRDNGTIIRHNSTASNNGRYGAERMDSGWIEGGGITEAGNTLGTTNRFAILNQDVALGARVNSSSGTLRLDSGGGEELAVAMHGPTGLQFAVRDTASPTSCFEALGSSIGQPALRPRGGAATISSNIQGKGSGLVYLGSQQAHFLGVNGVPAGQAPQLISEGSATNIDLHLKPKGSGQLRWGVHAGGSVTANGYVEWKLDDGSIVRVAAQKL
jgi:hypothetical protein